MKFNGKTDVGIMRHSNQDDYRISQLPDGSVLAIVCDGMGGANAGNVASSKAAESIVSFFERSYRNNLDHQGITALMQSAILSANIEIYDMSQKNTELMGMGTTAVAAYIGKDFMVISHVGDSRAYLINDSVTQLTRDHSVVQSLVESGKLTPEEARVHPRRNVITRALGIEPEVLVDSNKYQIKSGEYLLLCSDGLSNFVSPEDIGDIFKNNKFEETAEVLIACANKNGGADNITVITIAV